MGIFFFFLVFEGIWCVLGLLFFLGGGGGGGLPTGVGGTILAKSFTYDKLSQFAIISVGFYLLLLYDHCSFSRL